jgi:hypothetical protein
MNNNLGTSLQTEISRDASKQSQRIEREDMRGVTAATQTSVLRRLYDQIVRELNGKHERFEDTRTRYERAFVRELSKFTKLKVYPSVWIGTRNCDILIPAVGLTRNELSRELGFKVTAQHRGFKGLVIEMNGPVHDFELKGKKDASKETQLTNLGIAVTVIENKDIYHPLVQSLLRNLSKVPRICSRQRKSLWRRIYIATILANAEEAQLQLLNRGAYAKK